MAFKSVMKLWEEKEAANEAAKHAFAIALLLNDSNCYTEQNAIEAEYRNVEDRTKTILDYLINNSVTAEPILDSKFRNLTNYIFVFVDRQEVFENLYDFIESYCIRHSISGVLKISCNKILKAIERLIVLSNHKSFSTIKRFVFESFVLKTNEGTTLFHTGDWEDELNRQTRFLEFILFQEKSTKFVFTLRGSREYYCHYLHKLFTTKLCIPYKLRYTKFDEYKVEFRNIRSLKGQRLLKGNIANFCANNNTPPDNVIELFNRFSK